jgi:Thioesterase-like superfamily
MRPVPLGDLTLETEVKREGRKIQLCAVRLSADGVLVVAATVLKIRREPQALPPEIADSQIMLPGPEASTPEPADFSTSPFVKRVSLRGARGRFGVPGPGAIWYSGRAAADRRR